MNQDPINQFQSLVNQAMRQVKASRNRRAQMQEELLTHLLQTYQEQLNQGKDERAAQQIATTRFGDLNDLQNQLRSSVPFFERCFFFLFPQPETPMSRLSKPLGLALFFVGFAFMFGLAVVMPATAKLAHQANPNLTTAQAIQANDVLRISLHSMALFAALVTLTGLTLLAYNFFTRSKTAQ